MQWASGRSPWMGRQSITEADVWRQIRVLLIDPSLKSFSSERNYECLSSFFFFFFKNTLSCLRCDSIWYEEFLTALISPTFQKHQENVNKTRLQSPSQLDVIHLNKIRSDISTHVIQLRSNTAAVKWSYWDNQYIRRKGFWVFWLIYNFGLWSLRLQI